MSETMGVIIIYSTQYFPNAKQKLFMHVMHITVEGKDDEFTYSSLSW
jgi:RPA family protein